MCEKTKARLGSYLIGDYIFWVNHQMSLTLNTFLVFAHSLTFSKTRTFQKIPDSHVLTNSHGTLFTRSV